MYFRKFTTLNKQNIKLKRLGNFDIKLIIFYEQVSFNSFWSDEEFRIIESYQSLVN